MQQKIFFFIILSTIYSLSVSAQSTSSPYSIFGPGEVQQKGFGKNMAMGGAGIGMPSNGFLNNINPASYSGLDSIHFLYEFGFEEKLSRFKSQGDVSEENSFNFKYIAMGFRVTNWWATSIGVAPFSNVGYSIITSSYVYGSSDKFYSYYEGSGGVNNFYWGNAFKLGKHWSLGFNTSYFWGSIIQDELIFQPDELFDSFIIERTDYLNNFYVDFGAQYSFKRKDWDYTIGAIFSPKQYLVSDHEIEVMTTSYSTVSSLREDNDDLCMPTIAGVGINMKKGPFINIAADYEFQKWKGIEYPTQTSAFRNSHRFAIGAESKPWGTPVTFNWFKKITYRMGASYQSSYLDIDGVNIDKKSIDVGLGIPVRAGGILNITVELGQKGTVQNRLIRENYATFHLNATIDESWFKKKIYY